MFGFVSHYLVGDLIMRMCIVEGVQTWHRWLYLMLMVNVNWLNYMSIYLENKYRGLQNIS